MSTGFVTPVAAAPGSTRSATRADVRSSTWSGLRSSAAPLALRATRVAPPVLPKVTSAAPTTMAVGREYPIKDYRNIGIMAHIDVSWLDGAPCGVRPVAWPDWESMSGCRCCVRQWVRGVPPGRPP